MTAQLLSIFLHIFLFQTRNMGYDDSEPNSYLYLVFLLLICLFFFILYRASRSQQIPTGHWSHHFADLQMSSQEFYASLEKSMQEVQIPDLSISRITYAEGGIMSSRREYLRVSRKDVLIDICAAPLGRGYFISWWQADQGNAMRDLVRAVPFIGKSLERHFFPLTYYRIDTEEMFRKFIHTQMLTAVDSLVAEKGLRALSADERKPIDPRR